MPSCLQQTLLNFNPMTAYTKWLADFIDVQRPSGHCLVCPTGGWGFNWGSGPARTVLILIPWYHTSAAIVAPDVSAIKYGISNLYGVWDRDFGLGLVSARRQRELKTPVALTSTAYYYDTCSFPK